DLYLATRAALKGVDPRARVVVGGLTAWSAEAFVRRMYRHRPDLAGSVDAIGFHPYFMTVHEVIDSTRGLRAVLKSLGAGAVPIDMTEMGWLVSSPSEDADRGFLLETLAQRPPAAGRGVAHGLLLRDITPTGS